MARNLVRDSTRALLQYRSVDFARLIVPVVAVCVLPWMAVVSDGQKLTINPRGTQVKTADSAVLFTCTLSDYEPRTDRPGLVPTINWIGPRLHPITATRGRVYVERSDEFNLRLFISHVTDADAGMYSCTAELPASSSSSAISSSRHRHQTGVDAAANDVSGGTILTESVAAGSRQRRTLTLSEETKLFLFEDIAFVDTPTHERHLVSTSPLLQCVATGQPSPEVSWRFNRRRIVPDGVKYIAEDRGLRLKRLDVWDNGTYECRAEVVSHGNVKSRLITLEVLFPPSITRPPVADNVVKGHNTTLRCHANGNPPVMYEWFREKKVSDMIRVKVRLAEGTDSYVIRDVSSDDEGRYFCRASNTYGTRESYVDIRMLVPPTILPIAGRIVRPEGSTLTLPCEATGTPTPQVYWSRAGAGDNYTDDSLLNELAQSGVASVQSGPGISTLVLRDVQRSYAMTLTCTASNVAGVEFANVSFIVEFSPSVTIVEREQFGWPGQTRTISCIATSRPLASMNWYRGEQYLTDSDTYRVNNVLTADNTVTSTLSISIGDNQQWLYGSYSCIAKNVHGYVTETAFLSEGLPPDVPRNVSVLAEAQTSVSLSATAAFRPGVLPVTSWRVQYEKVLVMEQDKAVDGDDEQPTSVPQHFVTTFTNGDNMTVTGLVADTPYTFSLSAGNAVGYGPTVKFRVTTLPLVPRVTHTQQPKKPKQPGGKEPEEAGVGDISVELGDSLQDGTNVVQYHYNSPSDRDQHQQQQRGPAADKTDALRYNNRNHNNNNNGEDDDDDDDGGRLGRLLLGDRATLTVAVAICSSVVVLILVIMSASCVLVWTRQRRINADRQRRQGANELGPVSESFALTPLRTPATLSRRPAVDELPPDPEDCTEDAATIQTLRSHRVQPGSAATGISCSSSVQQIEWQRMLSAATTAGSSTSSINIAGEDGTRSLRSHRHNTPPPAPPPRAATTQAGQYRTTPPRSTAGSALTPSSSRRRAAAAVAGRTGVDETGYHSADNVDDDIDKIDESITSSAAGAAAASGTKVSLHTRANNSQQQGMMGNMAYYSCAPSRHA